MTQWNIFEVSSTEMFEHGVYASRSQVSPVTSSDRKRSLSAGDGHDDNVKRRITDHVFSTMSLPTGQILETEFYTEKNSSPVPWSSYGGVHTSSYPVSSLYYSPSQRDDEFAYTGSFSSQLRSSPATGMGRVDGTSHRSPSYMQLSNADGRNERLPKADIMERYGYPSYDTGVAEQGYPGQYDFHEYPQFREESDMGRRNEERHPTISSYVPPPPTRNRFNLSRYQLDDDKELFASLPNQSAAVTTDEDVKPNRFKTQRERLMQARAEESDEESDSSAPEFDEACRSSGCEDSSSRDSFISQRERLKQFSNEHSHNVVIPNQWEGESQLHQFVDFGNIEAALRPLGLMMARAALVNDSVNSRHHRSSSSGAPGCHSSRSKPLFL